MLRIRCFSALLVGGEGIRVPTSSMANNKYGGATHPRLKPAEHRSKYPKSEDLSEQISKICEFRSDRIFVRSAGNPKGWFPGAKAFGDFWPSKVTRQRAKTFPRIKEN